MLTFQTNQLPLNNYGVMYELLTNLVAAGWQIVSSGDGLSAYSSSGNVFSNGFASGANGLGNTRAWFRAQAPLFSGVHRELVVQMGATGNLVRVKYSPAAGFVGGAPSANTVPSATDEGVITGGGTDASPTFTSYISGPNGAMRAQYAMGDASIGYSFCMIAYEVGTGPIGNISVFWMDVLSVAHAADLDPCVLSVGFSSTNPKGFMGALTAANFGALSIVADGCNIVPTNTFDNTDDFYSLVYVHSGATLAGVKGYSSIFYANGVSRGGVAVENVDGVADRLLFGNNQAMPWPGAAPLP
jgi:hypothetical protein